MLPEEAPASRPTAPAISNDLKPALEALLFVASEPLPIERLVQLTGAELARSPPQ